MRKRGQVTIFIIVAVFIVALIIIGYFFYPEIKTLFGGELVAHSYLMTKVKPDVLDGVQMLSMQGGYADPEGFILHNGNKVKYLCYTSRYHEMCRVQQPLIKAHFEQELEEIIDKKTKQYVQDLRREYEGRGFTISEVGEVSSSVEIVPKRIIVKINAPFTATKDTSQRFTEFTFEIPSEMYDLLMISNNILSYESAYGDSETSLYIQFYPELRIHKEKLGDGSTIYGVENVYSGEEFNFASRSLAWPGGYGLEG